MYYPLSQIKPNLFTNGGEFRKKSDRTIYIGPYWAASDGKYFTGENPQATIIDELIPLIEEDETSSTSTNKPVKSTFNKTKQTINYINVRNPKPNEYSKITPQFNPTLPTEEDYNKGSFTRYFCKKNNELVYIETDKKTFDKLTNKEEDISWEMYTPFSIVWILTGEQEQVYRANRETVEVKMKTDNLHSFDKYLKEDYLKYYKS